MLLGSNDDLETSPASVAFWYCIVLDTVGHLAWT
jgi:hypothetical protein